MRTFAKEIRRGTITHIGARIGDGIEGDITMRWRAPNDPAVLPAGGSGA